MPASQPFQPWLLEQLRNDPDLALAYLNAALDENDPATFVLALRNALNAILHSYPTSEVSDIQAALAYAPSASTEDALALLAGINLHFNPDDFNREEANVRR